LKRIIYALSVIILTANCSSVEKKQPLWTENIKVVFDNTTPLKYDRGKRLPLYLWPAIDPGELDDKNAELLVEEFSKRGVGLVCSWDSKNFEKTISVCLAVARAQKKLGQLVNIDATSLLYSFFNGDEKTAHIDENDIPFFDNSFGKNKMGCPYAIDFRKKDIRENVEFFVRR
jgi:hypothetical protein